MPAKSVSARTRPTRRIAPWKLAIPIVVVLGFVGFMVLYKKAEDRIHDDANPGGALAGHPVADLEAKYGPPDTKKNATGLVSVGGAPAKRLEVLEYHYAGTVVTIYDGKVYRATTRSERIAEVEKGK